MKHPLGLYVLYLTEVMRQQLPIPPLTIPRNVANNAHAWQLWERFSFYGMKALLVLYLNAGALNSDRLPNMVGSSAVLAIFGVPARLEHEFVPAADRPLKPTIRQPRCRPANHGTGDTGPLIAAERAVLWCSLLNTSCRRCSRRRLFRRSDNDAGWRFAHGRRARLSHIGAVLPCWAVAPRTRQYAAARVIGPHP